MRRCVTVSLALWSFVVPAACRASAAEIRVEPSEAGAKVRIDGALFTEYVKRSGTKPILWPILGPTGERMTRHYPIEETSLPEAKDHPHHRSLWFTHAAVNGVNFWDENRGHGVIKHREFVKMESGPRGVLVTRSDWVGPNDRKVCEDEVRFTFGVDGDSRWIDYDITIKASEDDLTFGDTKEGSFGLRVAESIKVDVKKRSAEAGGKIVNSRGLVNADAWGRKAEWVDYHGPINGQVCGIAVMNHPTSFRYPTNWHVRTYGLFAANPFGWHDFPGGKGLDGTYKLPKGESVAFRYRILLHKGDEKQGRVADAFKEYAKNPSSSR